MRLQILEPRHHTYLVTGDRCWHYGEYTSEGGYKASDTNQKILNLKKKPTVSEAQLYYKNQAITTGAAPWLESSTSHSLKAYSRSYRCLVQSRLVTPSTTIGC